MSHLYVVLDDVGPLQPLVLRDPDLLPDVLQVAQRLVQARHRLRRQHLATGGGTGDRGQGTGQLVYR